MKLFSKKDIYNIEKEIRKADWDIKSAFGLLILIVILAIFAIIIGIRLNYDLFGLLGYTVLGVICCIIIILFAYDKKKSAGIVVKYDENGIFYWDANKNIEKKRVDFNNISNVYWDPSNWTTYVSILERKGNGKIEWHTFVKESMSDQKEIKQVLSSKVEFHNRKLSQKEIDNLLERK